MLDAAPPASELLADKAYDSDALRENLIGRGMRPVIPNKDDRRFLHPFDRKALSRSQCHRAHVLPPQGLQAHRNPLRQARQELSRLALPRRSRIVLTALSLDPSLEGRPCHALYFPICSIVLRICTAFDSCFQHIEKARLVVLIYMSLVPKAGAADLIPARTEAQP